MRNELNERWVRHNPLTAARDRQHYDFAAMKPLMGDVSIHRGGAIAPVTTALVKPVVLPMSPPMVRQMGATTHETRQRSTDLWSGTPFAKQSNSAKVLGDIDITSELAGFDSVGWKWDRRANVLCAYLTTKGQTYMVKIPGAKLRQIFNNAFALEGHRTAKATSIDGLFRNLTARQKANRRKRGNVFRRVTNGIKQVVKTVGKTALKIAQSPVFAGVCTAIAAIPPLTAVGGAGLAAFAAANAAKPALKALEAGAKAIKGARPSSKDKKAEEIVNTLQKGMLNMPPNARNLLNSALKSVPATQLTSTQRLQRTKRAALSISKGVISRT